MDYSLVRSVRWEGRRGRERGGEEEEGRKEGVRRMENRFENVASEKCLQREANQPQKGKAFHNNSWATLPNVSNRAVQFPFRDLKVVKFHARMY